MYIHIRQVSDRAVQLTGFWSLLPPELVSHRATTTSLTWITQMTLSSLLLTKRMTFIVLWWFLRQQRRNSAYMYLGRRRRFRIWVRVNLHLAYVQFAMRPLIGRSNWIYIYGVYLRVQVSTCSTRHYQAHWHRFYCHATTTTTTICGDTCPLSCVKCWGLQLAQCTRPQGQGS